jgi:hypothetical protein
MSVTNATSLEYCLNEMTKPFVEQYTRHLSLLLHGHDWALIKLL